MKVSVLLPDAPGTRLMLVNVDSTDSVGSEGLKISKDGQVVAYFPHILGWWSDILECHEEKAL